MMCLPKSFYIMRWLLHNVYSVINFISASLVFITLLVYLLLPPLRNNIQGCSMICFLACLVVMHLENGIFLAKKYEPHTWCLNRGKLIPFIIPYQKCHSSSLFTIIISLCEWILPISIFHLDHCHGLQHLAATQVRGSLTFQSCDSISRCQRFVGMYQRLGDRKLHNF